MGSKFGFTGQLGTRDKETGVFSFSFSLSHYSTIVLHLHEVSWERERETEGDQTKSRVNIQQDDNSASTKAPVFFLAHP